MWACNFCSQLCCFHPSRKRRIYRFASSGETGASCGVPLPLSLFTVVRRLFLRRTDEAVEKVRALARGEYGELHVGYAPSPTVEILLPALLAFQKVFLGSGSCCTTSPSVNSSTDFRT